MGKKSTQTQTNLPTQFVEPPKNENYEVARNYLDNLDYRSPIIEAYGQQDAAINEAGNDTFGANTSPEVAGKVRQSRLFRSKIDKGRDLSNAVAQENNAKFTGYMSVGDATKAVAYNPGGTVVTKTPFDWGGLLSTGIQGATAIGTAGTGTVAGKAAAA